MRLSIVVPAYNASDFIEVCLDSLLDQGIPAEDYEILVVNDGSTDNTAEIVDQVSRENPRVRLIQQENGGNGAARNTGLDTAQGEYFYFIDADDYLARGVLGPILEFSENNQLDMLGFGTRRVKDSHQNQPEPLQIDWSEIPVLEGIDFIAGHNYEAEVWWYMSRRSYLAEQEFRFYDRKFIQDSFLTPTLLSGAKRLAYVPWNVHRYRMSENSITRRKSPDHFRKHFEDMIFAVGKLTALIHKLEDRLHADHPALLRLNVKQQRYAFLAIIRFIRSGLPVSEFRPILRQFRDHGAYPFDKFLSLPDYRNPKNEKLVRIFNREFFLPLTIRVMRIFKLYVFG